MRVAKETDRAAWVESIEAAQDAEVAMTPRRPVSITRTHTLSAAPYMFVEERIPSQPPPFPPL